MKGQKQIETAQNRNSVEYTLFELSLEYKHIAFDLHVY